MAAAQESSAWASVAGKTVGGLAEGEPATDTSLEVVENGPRTGFEAPAPLFEPYTWAGVPRALP